MSAFYNPRSRLGRIAFTVEGLCASIKFRSKRSLFAKMKNMMDSPVAKIHFLSGLRFQSAHLKKGIEGIYNPYFVTIK